MAVYNLDGTEVHIAYFIDGTEVNKIYNMNGTEVADFSSLIVMSYNIMRFDGINSNALMQTDIISTYKPDIVGLQEMGDRVGTMPLIGRVVFEDYPYQYLTYASDTDVVNGTGIVSKIQPISYMATKFKTQSSVEKRGYQKMYFSFRGKTICWLNAHLEVSNYETIKVGQANELYEMVKNEEYFIITGDFNTVCKSINDTEYTTIMRQFIDAGYNSANCSEQFGFLDTWTGGKSISSTWYPCDHVITSANIDINEVIVDTTKIGVAAQTNQVIDHLPIIAKLAIK